MSAPQAFFPFQTGAPRKYYLANDDETDLSNYETFLLGVGVEHGTDDLELRKRAANPRR